MAARALTKVMKAVRIHRFGGPEVLTVERDVPIPQPKDTEQGDKVYSIFSLSGTYAKYYVSEEKYVFHLHDSVDYHQGAAIGIPYYTAYRALAIRCKAKAGQSVLVHGASGAVGLASCQIGQALGLKVIGTAGTDQGLDLIKKNGAQSAFNHKEGGYIDKIKEATGGVDIILEMLADVNLAMDCQLCKYHGKIAVIGSRASLDFAPRLLMASEVEVYGVALQSSSEKEMREMESYLYRCQELGLLKPVVGKVYPLEDASEAHRNVIDHSGGSHGKIILTTS
ncbi:hypothetical protein LSH36_471g03013 [Paralvinella palmiformis]|uniref:Enoyl reductase (ER) domain-containing protein n=1 Tax=Paralvinella palmiformis TaxID=53620 RepID=A0AAD9MXF4_9ANNE|nr:hypothetical protein LSH36_471g03013 [Paralvinella palmiformis]